MPVGTSEPGPHPECYQVLQGSAASPEPQPEVQMEKLITEMTDSNESNHKITDEMNQPKVIRTITYLIWFYLS